MRVCNMQTLFFRKMPGVSFCYICILLVLVLPGPGVLGFIGDKSVEDSFTDPSNLIPTTAWSTAFEQPDAIPLVKGKLLTTTPALGKQWRVSFEVFPESFNHKSLASVFHMMTGEKGKQVWEAYPCCLDPSKQGNLRINLFGEETNLYKEVSVKSTSAQKMDPN